MAVGFSNEPEKKDETWTKEHKGRTYAFTVSKKGKHHFVYYCSRSFQDERAKGDSSTGFASDHELTRDEVEKRPPFVRDTCEF